MALEVITTGQLEDLMSGAGFHVDEGDKGDNQLAKLRRGLEVFMQSKMETLLRELAGHLAADRKIEAIKRIRQDLELGLKESKDLVETFPNGKVYQPVRKDLAFYQGLAASLESGQYATASYIAEAGDGIAWFDASTAAHALLTSAQKVIVSADDQPGQYAMLVEMEYGDFGERHRAWNEMGTYADKDDAVEAGKNRVEAWQQEVMVVKVLARTRPTLVMMDAA